MFWIKQRKHTLAWSLVQPTATRMQLMDKYSGNHSNEIL